MELVEEKLLLHLMVPLISGTVIGASLKVHCGGFMAGSHAGCSMGWKCGISWPNNNNIDKGLYKHINCEYKQSSIKGGA